MLREALLVITDPHIDLTFEKTTLREALLVITDPHLDLPFVLRIC